MSGVDPELIHRIARGRGVKYVMVSTSAVACDAGCSATQVRRFLLGAPISEASARRIRNVLGLDSVVMNE